MLDIIEDEKVDQAPAEPGDHDKFAHYVRQELIADAIIFGTPLEALCGKKWIPSRDPSKFPVCPECKAKWEEKEDN